MRSFNNRLSLRKFRKQSEEAAMSIRSTRSVRRKRRSELGNLPYFLGHRSDGTVDVVGTTGLVLFTVSVTCSFEKLGEILGCAAVCNSGIFLFDNYNGTLVEPGQAEQNEYALRLLRLFRLTHRIYTAA